MIAATAHYIPWYVWFGLAVCGLIVLVLEWRANG